MARSIGLLLIIAGLSAASLSRGEPARNAAPPPGVFQLETGEYLLLWRNGEGQPMVGLPGGRVRALFADDDGAHYGPSLGVEEPAAGWIRLSGTGGSSDGSIIWQDGAAPVRGATRVALRERDVTITARGIQVSGTVILPPGPGPFPAVVFTHGSGPETRDASRPLAYALASHGIGALVYDKAGSGLTQGGDPRDAFDTLAADALAGVALMRARPEVDPGRVGLFGPSQGGWVSVLAASRSREVAYLLLQSADATTPLEQELYRGEGLLRTTGKLDDADVAKATAFRRRKFEFVIEGGDPDELAKAIDASRAAKWFRFVGGALPDTVFWRHNGGFDPRPCLEAIRCPVLAVFGERDVSKDVPLNAAGMRAAFAKSNHPDATVMIFPRANHGMFETLTGEPLERELPRLDRIAPGYPDTLANWVLRRPR
ncbi:MAG: alpha/beta hydrolase [Candidatus Eisenbacteria bacterium]